MSNYCVSCGKADANLKACKACKMVKYCGVECQVAHRPAHKKACREKAKELFDQKLYAQPPRKEECPICMLTLPCEDRQIGYMVCCGKSICNGCNYCLTRTCCPFCNTAACQSNEETIKMLTERMENYNDPEAIHLLGFHHTNGEHGLPFDKSKAVELFRRASELGSAGGHYSLGNSYERGNGTEIDMKRAVHHWQIAAMMGHTGAREKLGLFEAENGNYPRAMKHFMIAAKCGSQKSLDIVKEGFTGGGRLVTKEEYENTLRDYQASCDETKSEQRDRAAVILARERE
eukprot:scaffold249326_cov50-Cyclotella_meneghiniana.AAC.4